MSWLVYIPTGEAGAELSQIEREVKQGLWCRGECGPKRRGCQAASSEQSLLPLWILNSPIAVLRAAVGE